MVVWGGTGEMALPAERKAGEQDLGKAHSSMWQPEQGAGFIEKMKEDTPEQGRGLVSLW